MQRLAADDDAEYGQVFAELVRLENDRRRLKELAYGSD
jgi:hypothetical protein